MRTSRASGHRLALLALLLTTFMAVSLQTASADEAASMYAPDAVVAIDLTLTETAREELELEPFEYVPATFSLATTDGTPTGIGAFSPPLEVGLRLKGNLGASFEDLDGKSAFKVKFDEYVDGQKFLGLEKMTLNNMVQDPSMLREMLAYRTFRDAGVPASRTGYAFVRVNGEPYGLYLNLETLDQIALERIFAAPFQNPPQHLYEASYGYDLYPGEAAKFEVDEGKSKTRTDLEALVAAVNASEPASFAERVEATADLQEMTRMWAVEKYIGHWDGYAGIEKEPGPNLHRPNNYYLYSDPLGRFQMLPWGTDQTWRDTIDFDARDGLMFDLCLEDSVCLEMFRGAILDVLTQFEDGGYEQAVAAMVSLLEPWQAIDPRKPYDEAEALEEVEWLEYFLSKRSVDAEEWLGIGPSTPPDGPGEPTPTLLSPLAPEYKPHLRILRMRAAGHSLRTHLDLTAPGVVTQLGGIVTRGGKVTVCRSQVEVKRPRSLSLRCKLTTQARERLRRGWLKVGVITRFDPSEGPLESTMRFLNLPRD